MATSHNDRRRGEWPPHPARLHSALVAAWAELERPDPGERRALEWIEKQGAPAIAASEAVPRNTVSHFVPVNASIGRTVQERRAAEIYDLMDQIRDHLAASGNEHAKDTDRLEKNGSPSRSPPTATDPGPLGRCRGLLPLRLDSPPF
ncbi:MAG: type I-U CRISPR-associated protein Csb2, partial [Rhodococcus sp.]|nr:type I-U CRISPR-associated protein Csb2 [Rhodococcus sp. (in: high G+C Gram-positive bacteria)]